MLRRTRILALVTGGALAAAPLALTLPSAQAKGFDFNNIPAIQKRLMSGPLSLAVEAARGKQAAGDGLTARPHTYNPSDTDGCPVRLGSNIKVNQNCQNLTDADLQGRAQSQNETSIAADPNRPGHLVASYNDYRRGDGNCYTAYSKSAGSTWADSTVPMSFTRAPISSGTARRYWQAGGDTSVAFDTRHNAYLSCQVFNRGFPTTSNPDLSSGFLVFRSTANGGASWNFPGRDVAINSDTKGTTGILEDKQLLTVDSHPGSPFRDRVYVSYTEFAADGSAYIYISYSKDYGETFSKRVLVSRDSPLCTNTYGLGTPKGNCNENQFSQPFTAADGSLYVVWANFNNTVRGGDNRNQMLLAKSTDGGRSFSKPVKVADYYDLPDCATYQNGQDPGRACVPEKSKTANSIFRAANYPVGQVNPKTNEVVVTFGSYINRHSSESNGCVPHGFSAFGQDLYTGTKKPGACNNDILMSSSTNGGRSFTGTDMSPRGLPSVNMEPAARTTDQFWQWSAFTDDARLVVSYMDRQYGNDEFTGYSDFSVSASRDMTRFSTTRATSSSMPPPTQFAGVFYGDYTGLAVSGDTAYPLWPDTRAAEKFLCPGTGTPGNPPQVCNGSAFNAPYANDQDAYTARIPIQTP
jgi:hypothetical protein